MTEPHTTPNNELWGWRTKVERELGQVIARLTNIETTLTTLNVRTEEATNDIRERVEQTERFVSKIMGIGVALAILIPLLWNTFIGPLLKAKP